MKLLIADDEARIRKGLFNLIEKNISVDLLTPVKNGQLALEAIKQHHPDIVLVDICMPKLGGLELIRAVKDIIPSSVIIIISGHDEFKYAKEAIELGVDSYMLKPIESDKLILLLKGYISQLTQRKELNSKQEWTSNKLEQHKNVLIGDFLATCCKGDHTPKSVDETIKHLNIHLKENIHLQHIQSEYKLRPLEKEEHNCFQLLQDYYKESGLEIYAFNIDEKDYLLINGIQNHNLLKLMNAYYNNMKSQHQMIVLLNTVPLSGGLITLLEAYTKLNIATTDFHPTSEIILEALNIISLDYSNPELTLQSIAKDIKVSHEYLSRLFKKELSISPKKYLTELRLRKAHRLIEKDQLLKVYEVAEQTGFSSQHYFCRAFKNHYGYPPTKLQR
jgi:two-component system response regulator YesN